MITDLQVAQIDQCPAGLDWGLGKKSLAQIRRNYKAWLERNGSIEDYSRWQIGSFANRPDRPKPKRVRRRLSDAPGLTVEQVAQKAGVAPQTVSKHIRKGWVKATRFGHRTVRIQLDDFHNYINRIKRK